MDIFAGRGNGETGQNSWDLIRSGHLVPDLYYLPLAYLGTRSYATPGLFLPATSLQQDESVFLWFRNLAVSAVGTQ